MSWTWRNPRVPLQTSPGWQAPHELVDDYAKRGVEIAKLTGALTQAEHMLNVARAQIRILNAQVLDLTGRIECQADRIEEERHDWETTKRALSGRVTELEQARVAAKGDGWADVVNAGLGEPEAADDKHRCPEALLLDGVDLHRCIRNGGHEGDHWNRGHERQWPQVEVDENCEVPW